MTSKEALSKLNLKQPPATRQEKHQYLNIVWQQENMPTLKDFLRWYNNKNVVLTLYAMPKTADFHHNKRIGLFKLGCILPSLAISSLHKSNPAKFYPFTEGDMDLLGKIREDMVGGPSIVFTRKTVVDKTFIRVSKNMCKV